MTRESLIETIKKTLLSHGVSRAYIFGSFARMDEEFNDIDIAIEPPAGKFSLYDLVGIEQEIADRVGMKVDLVLYRTLKPRIKAYVDADLVPIL